MMFPVMTAVTVFLLPCVVVFVASQGNSGNAHGHNQGGTEPLTTTQQPSQATEPVSTASSHMPPTPPANDSQTQPPASSSSTGGTAARTDAPTKKSDAPTKTSKAPTKKLSLPPEKEVDEFQASFKMDMQFTPELDDPNSKEFQDTKRNMTSFLNGVYKSMAGFIGVDVAGFARGSVITRFSLYTHRSSKVTSSQLTSTLNTAVQSGGMSWYRITSVSYRLRPRASGLNGGLSIGSTAIKPYWFFLYGFGAMIGAAVLILLVKVTRNRMNKKVNGSVKPSASQHECMYGVTLYTNDAFS